MQRAIAELTSCLMRHAVDAEIHIEVARQESSAEALGRLVGLLGSDMVVSGAWGHSRYFELISGGVTRHLMRYSSVPVFFSH